jgi:hypothetical protein
MIKKRRMNRRKDLPTSHGSYHLLMWYLFSFFQLQYEILVVDESGGPGGDGGDGRDMGTIVPG